MNRSSKLLMMFAVLCLSAACNKVNPEVFLLNSGDGEGAESAPKNGRITLGSDSAVLTGGGYKLKGRVSTIEPAAFAGGGYKLRGTVHF